MVAKLFGWLLGGFVRWIVQLLLLLLMATSVTIEGECKKTKMICKKLFRIRSLITLIILNLIFLDNARLDTLYVRKFSRQSATLHVPEIFLINNSRWRSL